MQELPKVDCKNRQLQKALRLSGGLFRLVWQAEHGWSRGEGIVPLGLRIAEKLMQEMNQEELQEAQGAFHGSSRLLAKTIMDRRQRRGKHMNGKQQARLLNGTNVFDTALDFASGRMPFPKE